MAAALEPGMWVEFVGPENGAAPFRGHIYCIECETPPAECVNCGDNGPGYELAGISRNAEGWSFCCCELRPIYRPRRELLDELLAFDPEGAFAGEAV